MTGEAQMAVVATKLAPPTLPNELVERPRLTERLDAALDDPMVRVVLTSAPAGSGKSTLLASWQRRRADVAWLQADRADTDPARFWGHVVAALAGHVPGIAEARHAVSGADVEVLFTRIANELVHAPPITLVIDDHHLVANPTVDDGLERLIEVTPSSFRLVLGTRVDPAIRLSRLRVRGQLTEIRGDALRFDDTEAHRLLADRELTAAQTTALCDRTEGWAAGLVLAGLSLRTTDDRDAFVSAFQGDDRLVVDYLTEEYLSIVAHDDLDRMLRTSILDRMTGPLVDAVCGTTDGDRWLRDLAASNQLLIGLDRQGSAFRYHHLLRDLLALEADRRIPTELRAAHLAAGAWHLAGGDPFRAVDHHILGGDLETAGDLIAIHANDLLNGGQLFTVLGLLERLGDLPERHSLSAVTKGWLNHSTGRFGRARHYHGVAERHDDGLHPNLTASLGIMVSLAEGDLATARRIAGSMHTPTESTQVIGLAAAATWSGEVELARRHIATARELAAMEPSDYAAALAPAFGAVVELERGDAMAAAELAEASLDRAADRGIAEAPPLSLAHAVLATTVDDDERSRVAGDRALELIRRAPEPFTLGYVLALVGDRACERGDERGTALLDEAARLLAPMPDTGITGRLVARVRARHGHIERPSGSGLIEELTDRELAVLHHLPSAMSQREIANELYVSLNTVKSHCRAIYRKLAVGDRKAAVQAARGAGILRS